MFIIPTFSKVSCILNVCLNNYNSKDLMNSDTKWQMKFTLFALLPFLCRLRDQNKVVIALNLEQTHCSLCKFSKWNILRHPYYET